MRVVLGVLVLIGVFLPAMTHKSHGYADSWAVEVAGGETKAQELAEKHGFLFKGQVSGQFRLGLNNPVAHRTVVLEYNV